VQQWLWQQAQPWRHAASIRREVDKTRLGDWEGDTVVSAGRKGGLHTLVERKTQLPKSPRATQKAAVRRLQPMADKNLT
jgi:IS30 family transposase